MQKLPTLMLMAAALAPAFLAAAKPANPLPGQRSTPGPATALSQATDPVPAPTVPHRTWPSYHPASPTVSLDERRESWDELSVGISRRGSLVLDGEKLAEKKQRLYFEDAQAAEALALLDQRVAYHHSAARWMVLAPAGMTILGAGVAYASSTVESSGTGTGYNEGLHHR